MKMHIEPATEVLSKHKPLESRQRDPILDGFRAYAVSAVIIGHAMAYRFADFFENSGAIGHQLQRLAGPLAELGVSIFFAISGYIITHLLLREEDRQGKISLRAFYMRRTLRILPPLLVFLLALFILTTVGVIATPIWELPRALFTCNLGLFQCDWNIAHTWSLAVEEQFYLFWPIIFLFAAKQNRWYFAVGGLILLITIYLISPWTFHSNSLSFATIAVGVCMALRPNLRDAVATHCGSFVWLVAAATAILGPLILGSWLTGLLTPLLVIVLVFGAYGIGWLRVLLVNRLVQWIGAMSYSLYLWQQLFLGPDAPGPAASALLLFVVAAVSLYGVERPFIRLSHRLSKPQRIDSPTVLA